MSHDPTVNAAAQVTIPEVRRAILEAYLSRETGNTLTASPSFWVGTQGDYDTIPLKNPNTIYMIVE